jgi:hypothetical protein
VWTKTSVGAAARFHFSNFVWASHTIGAKAAASVFFLRNPWNRANDGEVAWQG